MTYVLVHFTQIYSMASGDLNTEHESYGHFFHSSSTLCPFIFILWKTQPGYFLLSSTKDRFLTVSKWWRNSHYGWVLLYFIIYLVCLGANSLIFLFVVVVVVVICKVKDLRDFTHCFSLCVTHKYCVWKANLDKNFLHPHSWPSFRSLSLSLTLSSSFYLTLSLSLLKGKVSWCVFVRRHTPPCLRTAVVQTDRNKK